MNKTNAGVLTVSHEFITKKSGYKEPVEAYKQRLQPLQNCQRQLKITDRRLTFVTRTLKIVIWCRQYYEERMNDDLGIPPYEHCAPCKINALRERFGQARDHARNYPTELYITHWLRTHLLDLKSVREASAVSERRTKLPASTTFCKAQLNTTEHFCRHDIAAPVCMSRSLLSTKERMALAAIHIHRNLRPAVQSFGSTHTR